VSLSDRWVAALVAAHREALFRYLARFTGDPDLAEDLVQETFVRLHERPPSERTEPRRWLFVVATNLARDAYRAERRRSELTARARDQLPLPDPPPDPATLTEREEQRARVRAALATLSERDRTVLLMREEGFTHREIAEAVDTTTKSVGQMVARALDKMARALGAEDLS
jgi:RNA polymerase sigma-70 factor (ECF subfamily)